MTPERIEQLRRDLPPPVVPGAGRKTHGRWIDTDGNVHAEISGKDDKSEEAIQFFREIRSRRIPTAVTDVEIKLAAHMRKHGIRSSILWNLKVGSLDVYYMVEHDENPVVVSATDGVDYLISRVRTESPHI